jgi:hypothetical protein
MKKLFFIASLTILCLQVKAQHTENEKSLNGSFPKIDGSYEYQSVITLDSTYKKDALYKNAKLYFVDNFKSAKDVIQYDEREQGKVIGKGVMMFDDWHNIFTVTDKFEWTVSYSTEITCKDGKYRYRLYDINIHQYMHNDQIRNESDISLDDAITATTKGGFKKVNTRLLNYLLKKFDTATQNIKSYMAKKQTIAKDDF